LKNKEDVDGRDFGLKTRFALSPGHDDAVGYSRISLNVMAALVAAIHVLRGPRLRGR
jgi:hypothetical protein